MVVRVECPKALDIPQLPLGTAVVAGGNLYCARQEDHQGFLVLPWVWGV